jgi:putative transposase
VLAVEVGQLGAGILAGLVHRLLAAGQHVIVGHRAPVGGDEGQMGVECRNHVPAWPVAGGWMSQATGSVVIVQVRYRYRIYPGPGQLEQLARLFGCVRVVYNDCLRLREQCHARGEKITDAEVQRRVITLAKLTEERAWLAEVASVGLVQACNDARRAYRNWFDSLAGRRKGRRVGRPRPRRKHGRQSARFTRNGFALHGERLYLAKVGDVKVWWSRPLPSAPSSVTVIRELDGRYYASFVVERAATPLPACDREVGIDLGLTSLIATSDGELIANPRFLRARERKLARAQRSLSRKQTGSANRARARHRVAVVHRKVRETRLDHAHKLALRLVRDNQAVYAEDLCISGLARTRLARSVSDAGWSQLVRLIEEKAAQHGRAFAKIGRFEPTSQVCSACGVKDGPKSLAIRTWQCAQCGAVHDRDINAAKNILAAGRADRLNACGGGVSPGPALAVAGEAGTHRSAA